MDLQQKQLYINRELSAISFNKRVLEQAMDTGETSIGSLLLSRLMFLSIVSSNLDEFFEVRVAGVKERSLTRFTRSGIRRNASQRTLAADRQGGSQSH